MIEKSRCQIVAETAILAVILTVISYFRGGVRYPFEAGEYFQPVWMQLLGNYFKYFIVFLAAGLLSRKLKKKV